MTHHFSRTAAPKEATPGRWLKRAIALFICATIVVAFVVGIASTWTSLPQVAAKAAQFSALMQIVRPLLLLTALLLWRPAFRWMAQQSWVTPRVYRRAVALWPQLMIWTCLIEITLGQGYVLAGCAALAIYCVYLRLQRDRNNDG